MRNGIFVMFKIILLVIIAVMSSLMSSISLNQPCITVVKVRKICSLFKVSITIITNIYS